MKLLSHISRVLVGSLFIVSGLIKANDPLGFSYKLQEYFSADVLNMTFLEPYALELAIFICISEVLLGIATLLGAKMKIVSWSLLLMILFFTFLTFYSAYFNKVTDCGCFGDAIKLTPWQSFYKDVVLLVLIIVIFMGRNKIKLNTEKEDSLYVLTTGALVALFSFGLVKWSFPFYFTAVLLVALIAIKRFFKTKHIEWVMAGVVAIASTYFTIQCVIHMPLKDFRPFAIGKSITEGRKLPEGAKPDKFETVLTYKNNTTGEVKDFDMQNYPWQDTLNWAWVKTDNKLLEKGDHPPIHDFNLMDADGNDITEDILNEPYIFLVVCHNINKAKTVHIKELNDLAQQAFNTGYYVYGVSASSHDDVENYRHEHQLGFDFLSADETVLKTMIRSNPGLILLKQGTVVGMWGIYDIPTFEEVKTLIKN